ncbi:MAG: hypothetical protein NC301_07970 [Bacteroides sp.]|nr:hypothetical protein [Bacteroides sp.]MCM1379273.1 hypothetical protein [Bacteroides sp.]MCM1445069.1 hypothetical protein [Prevotella sp.]
MKLQNLALAFGCLAAMSCGSKKETVQNTAEVKPMPIQAHTVMASPVQALPKAVVYKMLGDATAQNVPVQVSPSGQIISFPAPGDVRGQEPLPMADGYLLDRRGIGPDSRFTKWTYEEYAAMKQAPTLSEIKAALIPGARPTKIHVLDMPLSTALSDTAAVNRIIRNF